MFITTFSPNIAFQLMDALPKFSKKKLKSERHTIPQKLPHKALVMHQSSGKKLLHSTTNFILYIKSHN